MFPIKLCMYTLQLKRTPGAVMFKLFFLGNSWEETWLLWCKIFILFFVYHFRVKWSCPSTASITPRTMAPTSPSPSGKSFLPLMNRVLFHFRLIMYYYMRNNLSTLIEGLHVCHVGTGMCRVSWNIARKRFKSTHFPRIIRTDST